MFLRYRDLFNVVVVAVTDVVGGGKLCFAMDIDPLALRKEARNSCWESVLTFGEEQRGFLGNGTKRKRRGGR